MDKIYLLLFGLLFMIDPLNAQFSRGTDFRTMSHCESEWGLSRQPYLRLDECFRMCSYSPSRNYQLVTCVYSISGGRTVMMRERDMAMRRAAYPFGMRGPISTFGGPRFAFGPGRLSFDSSGFITDTRGPGVGFTDTSLLSPGSRFGSTTDLAFNPFVSSPLRGLGFPGFGGPISTVGPVFRGSGFDFPPGTSGPFGPGTVVPGSFGPGTVVSGPIGSGTTGLLTPGGVPIDPTSGTGEVPGTGIDTTGSTTDGEQTTGTSVVQPGQGVGPTAPTGTGMPTFPIGPGVGPFPGTTTGFPGMPGGAFGPGPGITVPSGPGITFPSGPGFTFPRGPGITFPSGPFSTSGPGSTTMFPGGPGPSTMFPGGPGTSTGFPGFPGFFPPGTVPGQVGPSGLGISTGIPGGPGVGTSSGPTTGTVMQPIGPGSTGTATSGGQGAMRSKTKSEQIAGINIPPPIFRPPSTPMPSLETNSRPPFIQVPMVRQNRRHERPPTLQFPPVIAQPPGPFHPSVPRRLPGQTQRSQLPIIKIQRPPGFISRDGSIDTAISRIPEQKRSPGRINTERQSRMSFISTRQRNMRLQAPLMKGFERSLPNDSQRRPNMVPRVKVNIRKSQSRQQQTAERQQRGFPTVPDVPSIPAGPPTGGTSVTTQSGGAASGTSSTTGGATSTGTSMPQPGMLQPGMPQPGMMQPGMMQPGTVQPGMFQPGMTPPGMFQPGMTRPGTSGPFMTGPFMTGPFTTGPFTTGPGMPATGMAGMGVPGMTRPSMPGMPPSIPAAGFSGPGMTSTGMAGMGSSGSTTGGPGARLTGPGMPGTNMPGTGMPSMGMTGPGMPGTNMPGTGMPSMGMTGPTMTSGTTSTAMGTPGTRGVGMPGGFGGAPMTRPGMPTPGMLGMPGSGMMAMPGTTTGGMGISSMGSPGMGPPGMGAPGMTRPMPRPGMTGPGMAGTTMTSTSGMQFPPGQVFPGQPIPGSSIFPSQTAQDAVVRQPVPGFTQTGTLASTQSSMSPNGQGTALQGGPQGQGLSGRPMFMGPGLQPFSSGVMGANLFPSAVGSQFQTGFTGLPSFIPNGPAMNSQPQGFGQNLNTLQGQNGQQNVAMTTQTGQQGQGQSTITTTNINTDVSTTTTNQDAALASSSTVIQDGLSNSQGGASVPNGFTLVEVGEVLPSGPQPEAVVSTGNADVVSTTGQNTGDSGTSSQTFTATSESAVLTSDSGPSGPSTSITEFNTVGLSDPTNPIGMPSDFSFFVPPVPEPNTQNVQPNTADSATGSQGAGSSADNSDGVIRFPSSPDSGAGSANSGSMNPATTTFAPQPDAGLVERLQAQGEPAQINVPDPVVPGGSA